ncbi:hypothetical protein AB0I28_27235 [Phytomonospora sp. NPDC050363]|uniref:hypothetical protein n=1 Tax=Phytomonospora sp. NPDC050363 TaxID=3155642 RepID=UPI0033F3193D
MQSKGTFYPLLDDIAAIAHPRPEPPEEGVTEDYSRRLVEVSEDRRRFMDELEAELLADDADPLLRALARARARKERAEAEIRALLAYGREVVRPRPYTLGALAEAAGMSFSGVRTAYGDADISVAVEAAGGGEA